MTQLLLRLWCLCVLNSYGCAGRNIPLSRNMIFVTNKEKTWQINRKRRLEKKKRPISCWTLACITEPISRRTFEENLSCPRWMSRERNKSDMLSHPTSKNDFRTCHATSYGYKPCAPIRRPSRCKKRTPWEVLSRSWNYQPNRAGNSSAHVRK